MIHHDYKVRHAAAEQNVVVAGMEVSSREETASRWEGTCALLGDEAGALADERASAPPEHAVEVQARLDAARQAERYAAEQAENSRTAVAKSRSRLASAQAEVEAIERESERYVFNALTAEVVASLDCFETGITETVRKQAETIATQLSALRAHSGDVAANSTGATNAAHIAIQRLVVLALAPLAPAPPDDRRDPPSGIGRKFRLDLEADLARYRASQSDAA